MKSVPGRPATSIGIHGWSIYDAALNLVVLVVLVFYGVRFFDALLDAIGRFSDFTIYYSAAKAFLTGQNSYDLEVLTVISRSLNLTGRQPHLYHYPPLFTIITAPLAAIDYRVARVIWFSIYLAALVLSIWLIMKGLNLKIPLKFASLAILLVVIFPPFYNGFMEGQVGPVLLALMVGAWYLYRRGYRTWAGALLAVASLIKLTPGLLVAYFLLRRDWKVCAGAIATGLGLIAATMLFISPARQWSYIASILPTERDFLPFPLNFSITGIFSRFFTENMFVDPIIVNPLLTSSAILALSALVLGISSRYCYRSPCDAMSFDLQYSLVIMTLLLVAPLTWIHHMVFLYLPLSVYLKWFFEAQPKPRGEMRLLLVALLLMSLPSTLDERDTASGIYMLRVLGWSWLEPYILVPRAPAWWSLLLSGKFWGLVALYILNIALIRKSETKKSQAARLDGH